MRAPVLLAAAIAALTTFGCANNESSPDADRRQKTTALFDPANAVVPFPTNLLFSGSEDGTLNISDSDDISDPQVALSTLDGFSTVAPFSASFSDGIDGESLAGGDNVRVFEVTLTGIGGGVTGIERELAFGSEYIVALSSVDPTGSTVVVVPLRPLAPKTSYLVALTNGILDRDGFPVERSAVYELASLTDPLAPPLDAAEGLRQLTGSHHLALAAAGVDPDTVVLSSSFTTQSVSDVLESVVAAVAAAPPAPVGLVDSGADSIGGAADLFVGTIAVPYYLSAPSAADPTAPLTGFWQGVGGSNLTFLNPTPVVTDPALPIPVLASIPKTPMPAAGYPVVVYQHGITTNRATLLGFADSLAAAGFAAVAIDLPLHGITGDETNGSAAFRDPLNERTFDLDLADNATGAPGPDGLIDSSGTHFINLSSLLTSRDNGRQAVADLLTLVKALPTIDLDGVPGGDLDVSRLGFVGHSLGGMVGSVLLALEPSFGPGVLGMPGGGVAKLLDGSATFGPRIAAGLEAAAGIRKGTAAYESFIGAFQTVVDSADPINYAASTAAGRGVLMLEVVGSEESLPDQVVPNQVVNVLGTAPSPTAGTEPLAAAMGLTPASESATGENLGSLVRYTAGHHGSFATPSDAAGNDDETSAAVYFEMQSQMATFIATGGTTLSITDPSFIAPAP